MSLTFFAIGFTTAMPWILGYSFYLATGEPLSDFVIFLMWSPFPLQLFFWILAFNTLVLKTKQSRMIMLGITIIIIIILQIMFFILLFQNPANIGVIEKGLYTVFTDFGYLYGILPYFIFFSTAVWFTIISIRSKKPDIRLKGKFLMLAIISAIITLILSVIQNYALQVGLVQFIVVAIITQSIRVLFGILMYIGITLPDSIKRRFLSE
jgi:hypothetical protein